MNDIQKRKKRVLLSKIGLDGHDRGVKMLATLLRNAGIEVIYLGLFQTPENIIQAGIQESVDMIGLSIHSGEHKTMAPELVKLMGKEKINHEVPVIVGGCIPWEDIPVLKEKGVKEVFPAGSLVQDIIAFINHTIP
jgi:methylmalonyl-CoA mutase C-terminal domain/subunit